MPTSARRNTGRAAIGPLEMTNDKTDDKADHGKVLATVEQRGNDPLDRPAIFMSWSHTRSSACNALMHGYGPTPVPRYQVHT